MKRSALILLVLFVFAFGASSWSQCPEDPYDLGVCDTMYVEPWADDLDLQDGTPPYFVGVPIYVTNDVVVDSTDSIMGFVIPLCFTSSNSAAQCTLDPAYNTTALHPFPNLDRSIFRNLEVSPGDSIRNRMMTMSYDFVSEWDTRLLTLYDDQFGYGQVFWMSLFPMSSADQRWGEGNKVLLATMTFTLQDSTTICIDTCLWPPSSRLAWSIKPEGGGQAVTKIPRSGTGTSSFEVCFKPSLGVREIQGSEDSRPSEFLLSQNYPNPFNPTTNFEFSLSLSAHVKIDIFNIVGQKVRTLVDEEMKPGVYVADWDGKDENGKSVSSGIYFYRMEAGEFSDMKKMVLVK